ncbi:MAG TPA: hypothetical protein VGQ31_13630 [Candidatus Limnocylindrales bacterium]|jgi:hypothetical protein|nr:hypothetical protein [Candidatus Limnocylindrales bacterium]
MTATDVRVPAVGGRRTVPAPDAVARDYILLALRLEQHLPGLVDGYHGPAALKAQVDMDQRRSPAGLADDASALRARLPLEVAEPDRRAWLDGQLIALETQAAALAGDALPYLDHVTRCFDHTPAWIPDERFDDAAARIDDLLPGDAVLEDRLAAWDARLEVPADHLPAVLDWLVERFRGVAAGLFGLPDGEGVRLGLVRDQPWSAYNWYDGGRHSRIDVNTDLPVRAPSLPAMMAHESYPGHHLEQSTKEAEQVDRLGRLESSILLINTPESLISEGLADLGGRFVAPATERTDLLVELFERAGIASSEPAETRATAARAAAIEAQRRTLTTIGGNAALLRHVEGRSHDEVATYLRAVGRLAPARAEKRLEFIEHPLWRTYVFVYAEGEALLERWVEAVPEAERAARFARLLREQLTPAAVRSPG